MPPAKTSEELNVSPQSAASLPVFAELNATPLPPHRRRSTRRSRRGSGETRRSRRRTTPPHSGSTMACCWRSEVRPSPARPSALWSGTGGVLRHARLRIGGDVRRIAWEGELGRGAGGAPSQECGHDDTLVWRAPPHPRRGADRSLFVHRPRLGQLYLPHGWLPHWSVPLFRPDPQLRPDRRAWPDEEPEPAADVEKKDGEPEFVKEPEVVKEPTTKEKVKTALALTYLNMSACVPVLHPPRRFRSRD